MHLERIERLKVDASLQKIKDCNRTSLQQEKKNRTLCQIRK